MGWKPSEGCKEERDREMAEVDTSSEGSSAEPKSNEVLQLSSWSGDGGGGLGAAICPLCHTSHIRMRAEISGSLQIIPLCRRQDR